MIFFRQFPEAFALQLFAHPKNISPAPRPRQKLLCGLGICPDAAMWNAATGRRQGRAFWRSAWRNEHENKWQIPLRLGSTPASFPSIRKP
jgi:hypothetical protein